ncbi:hypothetical protein [Streptomyces sp. NBC_00859]|nr:hypothetical protein OG584_01675 [Streptomyces sp. NBC_00859]
MSALSSTWNTQDIHLELSTANIVFAVRLTIKGILDRTPFGPMPRTGTRS